MFGVAGVRGVRACVYRHQPLSDAAAWVHGKREISDFHGSELREVRVFTSSEKTEFRPCDFARFREFLKITATALGKLHLVISLGFLRIQAPPPVVMHEYWASHTNQLYSSYS